MKKIAIFASGSGSNAQAIIEHVQRGTIARVDCVLSNKSNAYALVRAKSFNIEAITFSRSDFYDSTSVIDILLERRVDFIVLAGFLWLVPEKLVESFPGKIVNIHPALLPKYGGKGMYGMHVHKSVIANKEKESGISIHYVNKNYDEGNLILQAKCPIEPGDTPESLAEKIHALEYEHFPKTVEKLAGSLE